MSKLLLQGDIKDDLDISSTLRFRPVTKQDKEKGSRIDLTQDNGKIKVEIKTKDGKTTDEIAYKSDIIQGDINESVLALITALTERVTQLEAQVAKLSEFAGVIEETIYFEGWTESF